MTAHSSAHWPRSDGDEQAPIALAGLAPILVAALLVPVRDVVGVADLALVLMAVVVLGALAGAKNVSLHRHFPDFTTDAQRTQREENDREIVSVSSMPLCLSSFTCE